jgi:hypothetical protein
MRRPTGQEAIARIAGRPADLPPHPVRVLVVGPPLRVEPLLTAGAPWTVLGFTDDPAEGADADVVVLTEPAHRDVAEVRRLAPHALVLAVVRRGAGSTRRHRLLAAGADVYLPDPDAARLAPFLHGPYPGASREDEGRAGPS